MNRAQRLKSGSPSDSDSEEKDLKNVRCCHTVGYRVGGRLPHGSAKPSRAQQRGAGRTNAEHASTVPTPSHPCILSRKKNSKAMSPVNSLKTRFEDVYHQLALPEFHNRDSSLP